MANRSGASNAGNFRATQVAKKQPAARNGYVGKLGTPANYGADNPMARAPQAPVSAGAKAAAGRTTAAGVSRKMPTAKPPIEMRKPPTPAPRPKKTGYAAKKTGKMYL